MNYKPSPAQCEEGEADGYQYSALESLLSAMILLDYFLPFLACFCAARYESRRTPIKVSST